MTSDLERLTNELTRLRQRGVDRIDRQRGNQERIQLPLMEALAEEAGFATTASRVLTLRQFMKASLRDYEVVAPAEAVFVRRLYVDTHDRTPGPGGPGLLLKEARDEVHLAEDAFRKEQRQHLLDYATFLLTREDDRVRRVSLPLTAVVLVLLLIVVMGLIVGTICILSH